MIHKNIYSNRMRNNENFDPYTYEFKNDYIINSFVMYFNKLFEIDGFIIDAIIDFCETYRIFISQNLQNRIISRYSYSKEEYLIDLTKMFQKYETSAVLDYFDICINILNREIQICSSSYFNPNLGGRRDALGLKKVKSFFINGLNELFKHNNLGYCVVNEILSTKESDFLHQEVICKPLTLLINEDFKGPLEEFKQAIEKYTKNDYENTVIEACKAFESTMKCILDKKGVTYDSNASEARKLVQLLKDNGLFDSFLEDSFNKVTNILTSGLPTVRNKLSGHGDGLEVNNVERSYASYTLNIAGSYIVFLIDRYYEIL